MKNRIWLDLDDTLIKSYYWSDKELSTIKVPNDGKNLYDEFVTFERPIAKELISFCKDVVGEENVNILTAADEIYAAVIINKLGFEIPPLRIHTSEDTNIFRLSKNPTVLMEFNNILIDDLCYYDNYIKMKYLGISDKIENYIQIKNYIITDSQETEIDVLNEVKRKIYDILA